MTVKGASIISGVFGFLAGSALTYLYLKSDSKKEENAEVYVPKSEREKIVEPKLETSEIAKDENLDDPTLDYIKAVRGQNNKNTYSQAYNETVEIEKDELDISRPNRPYVIDPKQLQELPGYNFFTLKYYDDGYLVDEDGEQIDDPDRVVGSDYMNHFGEYEEDEVCIRNDVLESDFMIIHMCVNYIDTI